MKDPARQSFPYLLSLLLVLGFALSCATQTARNEAAATPEPERRAVTAEAPEEAYDVEAEAEALEARARDTFQLGIELHRSGHRLESEEFFDEALLMLAEADPRLAENPRVTGTYDEMMAVLEALAEEPAADHEALEGANADLLADIEALISPERAAEEAEVVADASVAVTYDYPVAINDQVLAWVDMYSGEMSERFARGLERSGWYLPMIKQIFAEEGVPTDLAYLAHVESSYKPTAYSRAHAKGVFQFISSTGRRYGLHRDWWIDERSDPEKSARAAARYLRDLHDEFGDWYLAMAGYNGGEGRVRRAIARTGSKDFWELSRRRFFRRETRNYVPAILAATIISKNPEAYGFGSVKPFPPVSYDKVVVDTPTDLRVIAECAGVEVEEIRRLNPALYRMQTPPNRGPFEVKIPKGTAPQFALKFAEVPESERLIVTYHKVRRGDTLSQIAGRYGTSVRAIQDSNGMGRRTMIREGAVLTIPTSTASMRGGPSYQEVADYRTGETVRYRVRRGDTLSSIARRFRTTVPVIQTANGLGHSTRIYAGQSLSVTYGQRSAHAVASAAPARPPQGQASASGGSVVVRRGDTLIAIARRHGTTVGALQSANGLGRSSRIYAGQTLRLPDGAVASSGTVYHRVRRGDTLGKIARRYGTSVGQLCRWNDMRSTDTLYPGQSLVVSR